MRYLWDKYKLTMWQDLETSSDTIEDLFGPRGND